MLSPVTHIPKLTDGKSPSCGAVGKPEFRGGPPTGARVPCPHEATVNGDSIRVVMTFDQTDGSTASFTHEGKRMPPLPSKPDLSKVKFGEPITLSREFQNADIEFEMKASKCQRVVFTLNGEGHIFRVTFADETPNATAGASKVPTRVIAWSTPSSKQNHGDTIKPEGFPDLPAVNEKWAKVKLVVNGDEGVLTVGDFQTNIKHTALARDKNTVMLTFAHGEVAVRNFRMSTP